MKARGASKYLARIESADRITPANLDAILRSHDIDTVALRGDDFPAFFNSKFERLLKQIEEAMGKPVNRSADRAESPFVDMRQDQERLRDDIRAVIAAGESKVVEFKSTGRKNLRTGEKDDAMEWTVVKSIAGARLGKVAAAGLDLRMGKLDGRTVARIDVPPGAKPQFATHAKGEKKPVFLVRINNSTQELFGDDAVTYQRGRWTD